MVAAKSPPRDLQKSGKALWRNITQTTEFDAAEIALLHQLCRVIDIIDRIWADIGDMGVTVAGSTGQPKANPLLAEMREQVKVADQLVTALAIPIGNEEVGKRRSGAARAVAKTRKPPKMAARIAR